MINIKLENKVYTFTNGNKILNIMPSSLYFQDNGELVEVESAGVLLNVKIGKKQLRGALSVDQYIGDANGAEIIRQIHEMDPDVIIVGSSLTMLAFPGEVASAYEAEDILKNARMRKDIKQYKSDEFRIVEK